MATSLLSTKTEGSCSVTIKYQGQTYQDLHLSVIPGLNFQSQYDNVNFKYNGTKPPSVSSLTTLNIEPKSPFKNLTAECHPIATKSPQQKKDDLTFISNEVEQLLKEGIIEPSQSPWRSQVVVMKDENHEIHLAIDYSQTINWFIQFDSFPLPRISSWNSSVQGLQYPRPPKCIPPNTTQRWWQALHCIWSKGCTLSVHLALIRCNQWGCLFSKRNDEVCWR